MNYNQNGLPYNEKFATIFIKYVAKIKHEKLLNFLKDFKFEKNHKKR